MVHWTRVVRARRKMARTTNNSAFNGGKRGRKATERGRSERWEHKPYEWDQLLKGKPYWTVLRISAWTITFKDNTLTKKQMRKSGKGRCAEKNSARDRDTRVEVGRR